MPYDWQNGLVFDEKVVSTKDQHKNNCIADLLPRPLLETRNFLNRRTASLQDMAMRTLCCNADSLESDALKSLPDDLLVRIKDLVIRSRKRYGLRIWTALAKTGRFTGEFTTDLIAGCSRCDPFDLEFLVPLINSPSLDWITHLELGDIQYTTSELMKVADIQNLRTLSIRASRQHRHLSLDRVLRAWSTLARERKAFQILKVIFLDMDDESYVSRWFFHYMNAFPALETIAVLESKYMKHAKSELIENGWRIGYSQFEEFADEWDGFKSPRHGCESPRREMRFWGQLVDDFIDSQKTQDATEVGDKPILHMCCGERGSEMTKVEYGDATSFDRDWDFQRRQAATKPAADKTEDEERPIQKRKIKDSKQCPLNDFLAGV